MSPKSSSESVVREIRRKTKKKYSTEEKIRIVLEGLKGEDSWCLAKNVAERTRDLIKNCTYFELVNSDHMVYADNPDQFYPLFSEFLNSL